MLRIIFQKLKALVFVLLIGYNASAQDHVYTLQECVEIALERNLAIQRGKLDLETSKINKTQAQWQRSPNLTASTGYSSSWGRSIDPTTNIFTTQQNSSASINANTQVTIFNGLQIHNQIQQSIVSWQAQNMDMEKSKNDVALNIASLYLTAIFNKELVANAQFQLNSTQEQLSRTQKLVNAGALPKTNMLDLRSQVASNEVALINAENNYSIALLNLKQALLVPAGDRFEIEVPEIDPTAIDVASLNPARIYETAEGVMPEVRSADLRIKEAEYGRKISTGVYSPSLFMSAGYSTNASSARQDLAGLSWGEQFREFRTGNVGLSLQIPIFNRMNTRSNVQKAMLTKQRAEITAQETRNQLRQTIEQSYNDLVAASKSYQANQHQVDALEESFRVTENQFNIGAVNFVDYQVANNQLFMAKSDLVRAKYDLIFKQKILDFYLGNPITL